jgi:hypothetical protein
MHAARTRAGERIHRSSAEKSMSSRCTHLDAVKTDRPNTEACEECFRTGDTWIHLRLCRTCGHVGCCDDSKNRHARKRFTQVPTRSSTPLSRVKPGAGASSTRSSSNPCRRKPATGRRNLQRASKSAQSLPRSSRPILPKMAPRRSGWSGSESFDRNVGAHRASQRRRQQCSSLGGALFQPILSADVVAGSPVHGIVEIGGPGRFRIDDLVRRVLRARREGHGAADQQKGGDGFEQISNRHDTTS